MKVPYSKEPVDFRLMLLVSVKRMRFVVYGICIGAILFGGIYYLVKNVLSDETLFSSTSSVYLEYTDKMELEDIYINKHTWETLVYNDYIMTYAQDAAKRIIPPAEAEEKVSATLLTDARIVVITAQSSDLNEAKDLADAFAKAVAKFAPELKEIDSARILKSASAPEIVGFEDRTLNMVIVGAIVGGVISFIIVILYFVWDTSIYVPSVTEIRYGIPALGITTDKMRLYNRDSEESYLGHMAMKANKKTEFYSKWLEVNYLKVTAGYKKIAVVGTSLLDNTDYVVNHLNCIIKEQRENEIFKIDCCEIMKEDAYFSSPEYELISQGSVNMEPQVAVNAAKCDAVIVLIKAGDHNGKLVERALDLLRIQGANVVGAILYDVNSSLIKRYIFSPFCSSTKKLKEDIYNTISKESDITRGE